MSNFGDYGTNSPRLQPIPLLHGNGPEDISLCLVARSSAWELNDVRYLFAKWV
jgi:hypothetical protein